MNAEVVWDARCTLGEGVFWHQAEQKVYFVDIKNPAVHAFTPATGARQSWNMPEMIGWLVPRRSGGWIAGLKSGVAYLTLDGTGAPRVQWLHRLHDPDSPLRLNDAKADAAGYLWFGTMNNEHEERPEGRLYRLDPDGALHVMDDGYAVTNGPCFSPDGRTLYHTDSVQRTIYAFDVSADRTLSNKRVWKRLQGAEAAEGYPDGMCIDSEGFVWVARWAAGCVTRLDAQGNEVMRINTNAPRTTNCCFGGAALSDLYITSARVGLDEDALLAAPASGSLLVARRVARGTAPHAFGG
ncbi:MAG TPA: SMP-30/gluconolactonase/LRE family protein [Candidatus Cybelea sp.]|nr:SMP-30/gluconolactonase/LRE family protein [Candidatus Cybelea sp.]